MNVENATKGKAPKSRRPRVAGGRPHQITLKLSEAEYAALIVMSERSGQAIQSLIIEAALKGGNVETIVDRKDAIAELSKTTQQLGAVGNNLNQLTRFANAEAGMPADIRASLAQVLGEVRQAIRKVDATARRVIGER